MKCGVRLALIFLAVLLGTDAKDQPHVPHVETAPHLVRDRAHASTGSGTTVDALTLELSDALECADRVDVMLLPA